ncbi:MAG TPA: two-component regulator propeller domain-containing protein [Chitinophagaceae bacterium]|nr:two-component regulator propeller domain-containing protein [Chitinophagaceae bacterium]
MRIFFVVVTICLFTAASAQNSSVPIGVWKEYLPYNSAIDVAAGDNKIYCATPYSLFTVDLADNSIERLSKITGLSETGVSVINYDETSHKLFIAYANSNIDIIYRNDIFNIPDIKRENIAGDKSIYNIYLYNNNYYLSTGLGVIVVDGSRFEVKESWFIGNGGSNVKVNGFTSDGIFFYAATNEGLKQAATGSANLGDYLNWQLLSGANGLSAGPCRNIVTAGSKPVALKDDSVFIFNGNNWDLLYSDGSAITAINSTGGKIAVCHRLSGPVSKVVIINTDGSVERTIQQNGVTPFPKKAILYNDNYWIADQFNCLSRFSSGPEAEEVYSLNSPEGIASGEMVEYNNVFYATAGEVDDSWNYQYNGNGIYRYKNGEWKNFNRFHYPVLDSMLDFITVAVDRRDESVWAGSFGGGLLHIKPDESFEIFKQNSPLQPPQLDPTSYRVAGLLFDQANNLWISNFGSLQPLVVRKADGNWKSFSLPFTLAENALAQMVMDDANQLWAVSPLGNGLVCYNYGSLIDDISDDHWKLYRSGQGNGNLPSTNVLCVARDKSGFIWAGTDDGVGVIQCPQEVFNTGCEAILPIVQQGNFAGYLFKGENVRSIAVDGADRKWVATKNGVWLISADGEKVIERFTEDNSPLLTSDVKKIAINSRTGEVYFATARGICSYQGTATEGEQENSNVLVFPNPVPPGYNGIIAIRGVAENAIVKITELDGRLVYQTKALGGQAVWDGKDYKGRKISTGIYLVLIDSQDKSKKTSTKIVFISK